jgi:hypothetical protein
LPSVRNQQGQPVSPAMLRRQRYQLQPRSIPMFLSAALATGRFQMDRFTHPLTRSLLVTKGLRQGVPESPLPLGPTSQLILLTLNRCTFPHRGPGTMVGWCSPLRQGDLTDIFLRPTLHRAASQQYGRWRRGPPVQVKLIILCYKACHRHSESRHSTCDITTTSRTDTAPHMGE